MSNLDLLALIPARVIAVPTDHIHVLRYHLA